jgi:hypothetical protein
MAKFTFQNGKDEPVTLVIEPWAMAETVPPGGTVVFEVADHPPPQIEFALTREGDPYVAVVSDIVRFRAEGTDWDFSN